MGDFKKGDWVFFEPWCREPELGRFVSYADNGGLFVCYGMGCTASNTASTMVRKANDDELPDPLPKIGYHRFDDYCPRLHGIGLQRSLPASRRHRQM